MKLFHDTTGLIHLVSAIVALISGSLILFIRKGTLIHKRIGYVYAGSMIVLNVTAFNIYHLFKGFGVFHIAALVSLFTLLIGLVPALMFRTQSNKWLYFHVPGMYYSVIGLYAAFASEVLTRIPGLPFFGWVVFATAVVMFIGVYSFQLKKKTWLNKR